MPMTFTDEEFKGYAFVCESADANVGFKHICKVFKDEEEIEKAKATVTWGNRTWESYQYQSVFESSKSKLREVLSGEEKPEYDTDFLYTLANYDYIHDYGYDESDELYILMDSWNQVEGDKKWNDETKEWELENKSVYAKLVELAEKDLLKPSINRTIKEVEYLFTDQYNKCDDCGRIFSTEWGELTWVDEVDMYLCDDCISENDNVTLALIESAREDFRSALKPTIDHDKIRSFGYEYLSDEDGEPIAFSCARDMWGESNPFYDNSMSIAQAQELCANYGGFAQIESNQQFDSPFYLVFPSECIEDVKGELE